MSSPIKVMRAWQYSSAAGGLHKALTLNASAAHPRPTSPPKLATDELLVRVHASSLQHMDHVLAGLPYGLSRLVMPPPASPGMDFAGQIVATGTSDAGSQSSQSREPSVRGGRAMVVGDAVLGRLAPTRFGSLGEIVLAKAGSCAPIPAGLSMVDASAIPSCGLAAYQSIAPYVPEGQATAAPGAFRILIHGGSGGCGTFGIQIAKLLGCHVTTTCSTPNVDLCKSLGADEVIDYTEGNLVATLQDTSNQFSLVVDNVGVPADLYKASDRFLLPQGTFVQVGSDVSMRGMTSLSSRMLRPSFLGGGSRAFKLMMVQDDAEALARIAEWMATGKVKSVMQVFDFADAPKAVERLQQRPSHGKVVVKGAN
ncbi:NADH oxidase [Apiospora kogelbergensis]|uniref:NADH oxidase n=1 Tax=Apiospora kogelbergensis TaxID=1337665 RepID=A0AAW0QLB7_9PEZI